MNSNLQIFDNPEFGSIRTVTIDGEPWFVGKDVALALQYKEPQKAVRTHVDEEDRGVSEMDTPGGRQALAIINESGLYSLIFGSKLESAKRFKHWVTSEVLPALRKTGHYEMPGRSAYESDQRRRSCEPGTNAAENHGAAGMHREGHFRDDGCHV